MDMNKILNNFEAASTGNYEPSKSETSDMKMILESFYDVAQEDAAQTQPQQLDEIASVTMSGDSADEVARLAKLMNGSEPEAPQTTAYQGPPDMPPQEPAMVTPRMMDDMQNTEEPVEEESWDNEPEVKFDDHHKMTKDLSGGLNRQKKSYGPTNGGDNPMALENSLAEELSNMLKKKMGEAKSWSVPIQRDGISAASDMKNYPSLEPYASKVFSQMDRGSLLSPQKLVKMLKAYGMSPEEIPTEDIKKLFRIPEEQELSFEDVAEQDQDGDGDEDFADVQIARMMASGMSKEEAKKKVKDKKYNEASQKKRKTDDEEVAEKDDDDPCWKNYKMVGTKKKNGKEVPNCVPKEGVEEAAPKNNPVAKNAGKFNKAQTHKDKKKAQKRGEQKHKGKEMAMESPVFDRYVKPFLDKTPSQIVGFYDREALNIIDRLSQERRTLAKKKINTQMHEAIIGKLREGLSALPEKTLNEARGRRYGGGYRGGYTAFPRSRSRDINRIGYGDGRGANLGSDKAAFKRREMEVELGDEEPNNYAVSISGKQWKVFRSQRAAQKAAATIKSKYGKDTKVYQTAAPASS